MQKIGKTIRIPIGPLMLKLSANLYRSDVWIGGYFSRVSKDHDRHTLMVDIDEPKPSKAGMSVAITAGEVIRVVLELSHIAVFGTGAGYHIVSADIVNTDTIVRAYGHAAHVLSKAGVTGISLDYRHMAMGIMREPRCWTLRVGPKDGRGVKIINYTVSERITGEYSLPHFCLIETLAGKALDRPACKAIECVFEPVIYRK